MVDIIRGSAEKYAATKHLVDYFKDREDINGTLYLGYPIIGSVDGPINIDAMLISEQHGVVIIDLVEGTEYEDRLDLQDELFNKVEAKLRDYNSLKKRRKFMVEINVITYASGWRLQSKNDDFIFATNDQELKELLEKFQWRNGEYYQYLMEAIQAVTKIKTRPKRNNVTKENSKGAILKGLEDSISNLDSNQSAAVIETADGPQRIRGLAGSGKTIVLALKVAYLHSKNPNWKIAVTFHTRSLKKQFESLITRFTYEHKREEPDWNKISIIQAWGSPSNEGIYFNVCKVHGIEYYNFNDAKQLSMSAQQRFKAICNKALLEINKFEAMYDVILIDEAQDFSKEFLKICYEIIPEPKRLIFAYDELQTLNALSMDIPENIFGEDAQGNPKVKLTNYADKPKRDIILKVCYRNSRPILATAHALGFGVFYDEGLIQMFGNKSLWKEVGYTTLEGELEDGEWVKLGRNSKASPEFLENHSKIDDLIKVESFEGFDDQDEWIAKSIKKNLEEDELRHQDIMVIHPNPITLQSEVNELRKKLYDLKINSHIAGSNNPDIFREKNSITITSIYRAKGNEAGMVYVMNAQHCYSGTELIKKRNILFTALTRSKGWVRVTGVGEEMDKLLAEYQKVKENDFELEFTYPTEKERTEMNIINRDLSRDEKKHITTRIENLAQIIEDIEKGRMFIEDLPSELRETLKGLFSNEE